MRNHTAICAVVVALLAPGGAARADAKLDVLECAGSIPEGALREADYAATGTISCTHRHVATSGVTTDTFTSAAQARIFNDPVARDVYQTQGSLVFPGRIYGTDRTFYLEFSDFTACGATPLVAPGDRVDFTKSSYHYNVRGGWFREYTYVSCVPNHTASAAAGLDVTFEFVAEFVSDLPV